MQFDSVTHGVHFYSLSATVEETRIHLSGTYFASDLVPALLFSVGVPWVEPCVKHVCCLWDMAERYKDHDLMTALGPACSDNANLTGKDLMKGNSVTGNPAQWDVRTMIHPSFVAMLFLCLAPTFYMYYEIVPMQWTTESSVRWNSHWYGQPCHQVIYPDGRPVCIQCFNSKPDNAVFVFTANWFATFQCQWVCLPGFLGPNCDIAVDTALYVSCGLVALLCVLGAVLFGVYGPRRAVRMEKADPAPLDSDAAVKTVRLQPPPPKNSEMITFKENGIPEIRIKLL